ncbi:hypothetical protein QOZ80_2AG0107810 [Eleusine coracana subsp. coracana]|nr:hypothetical protein QOZ80_2AG0107810 [Eleusine coracana subsp. coracana]
MSSATSMVTPSAVASSSGGGDDDVGCRACYGLVVACLSLLLFCVLAGTVGVVKACAATGLAVAFFGFVGWLAHPVGGRRATVPTPRALRRARQAFGLVTTAPTVRVPPAFAYAGCVSALCAVCLEDVQRGEAVRRLPACGHLFHRDCVDMWLHSHATCPLCRSDLVAPPRNHAAKSATTTTTAPPDAADAVAAPQSSSTNALPPV